MFGTSRTRLLAVAAGAAALVVPACAPASSGGTSSLNLSGTCTPGDAGQIELLPSGNTGTLHIETLPGGGLSVTCVAGSETSTTTTTSPESTTTTTSPDTTTTTLPDTTTTTLPDTTTTTVGETTTTVGPTT
jgi:hypothetical protein